MCRYCRRERRLEPRLHTDEPVGAAPNIASDGDLWSPSLQFSNVDASAQVSGLP